MWTRKELKQQARQALQRNYWKSVLVAFVILVLGGNWAASVSSSVSDGMGTTVAETVQPESAKPDSQESLTDEIAGEMGKGKMIVSVIVAFSIFLCFFLLMIAVILAFELFLCIPVIVGASRFMLKSVDGKADVKEIAYAFDHSYQNVVRTMFHTELSIFLWALLFLIPGIYKEYEYRMVEYILAEQPDLHYKDAMRMSREMMHGEKWKAFILDLSFLPWKIVGVMTCGIAYVLFTAPYQYLTNAALYRRLSAERMGALKESSM